MKFKTTIFLLITFLLLPIFCSEYQSETQPRAKNQTTNSGSSGLINNYDIIIKNAADHNIPAIIPRELKEFNDTGWNKDGTTTGAYCTWDNDISFPERFYKKGSMELKDPLMGYHLGTSYNEMLHAFWDKILAEDSRGKWIYGVIIYLSEKEYGNEEMLEEAFSETWDAIIQDLYNQSVVQKDAAFRGKTPKLSGFIITYDKHARAPGHEETKFKDYKNAGKVISEDAFKTAIYLLKFGIDKPKGKKVEANTPITNLQAIKETVGTVGTAP